MKRKNLIQSILDNTQDRIKEWNSDGLSEMWKYVGAIQVIHVV